MCEEIIEANPDLEIITTCDCGAVEIYIDCDTKKEVVNINTNKVDKTLLINQIVETNPNKFIYTKTYNKLVRDNVPEILKLKGYIPNYKMTVNNHTCNNIDELIKMFENKIYEEWVEYCNSKTEKQKVEEIGDMIEVLFSLAERYGMTRVELTNLMIKKNITKGQFKDGMFLIDIKRYGEEIE